jgi:hypothetical protein
MHVATDTKEQKKTKIDKLSTSLPMKDNNNFFFFLFFFFLSVDTPKVCKQCHHFRAKPSEEI